MIFRTQVAKRRYDLGVEPGKVLVLWQGIIFPYKGIDLLLNAWQKVEARDEAPAWSSPERARRNCWSRYASRSASLV